MQVREIMSQNPGCCHANTSLQEVAQMMVQCDCGAIPVLESDQSNKPIGMITDRDITVRVIAAGQNPLEKRAGDAMTTPVATIRPDADLRECEQLMEQKQLRRILVVDDNGECIGIVSQADIARRAPEHDTAEVVRDISQPGHGHSYAYA